MTQVRGEEGHLVGACDKDAFAVDDRVDRGFDLGAADLARRLLDVRVIRGDGGLVFVLVEREKRLWARRARSLPVRDPAAVLLARGGLKLRKALEAECLGEAHDCGTGGVRSSRELFGRLKGDFLEMVDDVL